MPRERPAARAARDRERWEGGRERGGWGEGREREREAETSACTPIVPFVHTLCCTLTHLPIARCTLHTPVPCSFLCCHLSHSCLCSPTPAFAGPPCLCWPSIPFFQHSNIPTFQQQTLVFDSDTSNASIKRRIFVGDMVRQCSRGRSPPAREQHTLNNHCAAAALFLLTRALSGDVIALAVCDQRVAAPAACCARLRLIDVLRHERGAERLAAERGS